MKYIECECCGFLAAIPSHDNHEGLQCPFCHRVKCDHGGRFEEISRDKFVELSELGRQSDVDRDIRIPTGTVLDLHDFLLKRAGKEGKFMAGRLDRYLPQSNSARPHSEEK